MPEKIYTVSDFQRKTKPTFDVIRKSKKPILVTNRNKAVGVFMNPSVYNNLVGLYEELLDSNALEKAIKSKTKSFKDIDDLEEILNLN